MDVDSSLAGADLSNRDLRGFDFRGKTLFGTDLRGSNLREAAITLACDTFDGVRLDGKQVAFLLMMLSLAAIPAGWSGLLRQLAKSILSEQFGAEEYEKMLRYMKMV